MRKIVEAWDCYWFGEASLGWLASFRISVLALCVAATWQARNLPIGAARQIEAGQRPHWNPLYFIEVLGITPLDLPTAEVLLVVMLTLTVLALLGVATRVTLPLTAAGSLLWWGLAYSYGQAHHSKISLIFALWALVFSPCGRKLSVDAWIARARGRPAPPKNVPWAALPLRVARLSVASGYFFAGWSKILTTGSDWLNGYTLQATMLGTSAPWAAWFAADVRLAQAMSIGLVLLQATFPLCLIIPRLRLLYVPAATSFHLLAWKTMDPGPYFTLWFVAIAAFFDPGALLRRYREAVHSGSWRAWLGTLLATGIVGVVMLPPYWRALPVEFRFPFGAVLLAFVAWVVRGPRSRFPSASPVPGG